METLETILLSVYYDYIPNQIRVRNRKTLTMNRQQMIQFLADGQKELEKMESNLSEDYQEALSQLQKMDDIDYQKLKGQLVPTER